jgi:hypothetical protein
LLSIVNRHLLCIRRCAAGIHPFAFFLASKLLGRDRQRNLLA